MERYTPDIENPYPDGAWSEISGFTYDTGLHLQRSIEAVQVREGDDADYILGRDYTVSFGLDDSRRAITVPQGMLTDLSSVPGIARSIIGRVGPHLEASIVHDFLYIAWQDIAGRGARKEDRKFADKLMREAMKAANVSGAKRFLIYAAVKTFGWSAYRKPDPDRYVRLPLETD